MLGLSRSDANHHQHKKIKKIAIIIISSQQRSSHKMDDKGPPQFNAPEKAAFNELCAMVGGPIILIDSPELKSVQCMRKYGVGHVDVINFKRLPVRSASSRTTVTSHEGVSTSVLKKLMTTKRKSFYKVAYLDYCGTPNRNVSTGCDPLEDFKSLHRMMRDDGLLIATFSKRGIRDTHLLARKKMRHAGFTVVGYHSYFSTAAMVVVMAVKRKFAAKRYVRLWKAVAGMHGLRALAGDFSNAVIEYSWCKGEKYVGRVLRRHKKHTSDRRWVVQWEHRVGEPDKAKSVVELNESQLGSKFRILN